MILLKSHTWLARFNIIGGYVAVTTGILIYYVTYSPYRINVGLIVSSFCVFFFLTIFIEILHRVYQRNDKNEMARMPDLQEMTIEEFKNLVFDQKKPLLIVDNSIL